MIIIITTTTTTTITITLQAPAKLLTEPYSALVAHLTAGVRTELGRVRAIYRWVTAQRLDRIPVPDGPPSSAVPLHQIWRIKNRKGNYAQLISILCRSVTSFPSCVVFVWFVLFQGQLGPAHQHPLPVSYFIPFVCGFCLVCFCFRLQFCVRLVSSSHPVLDCLFLLLVFVGFRVELGFFFVLCYYY